MGAPGCPLTIAGVVVELRVGLDVHRGAGRDLRHMALQLRVNGQVSMLVDAAEPLLEDQLARVPHEGHLSLAGELTPWKAKSVCRLAIREATLCPPLAPSAGHQGDGTIHLLCRCFSLVGGNGACDT